MQVKPTPWLIDPRRTDPAYAWFWSRRDLGPPFLVNFWTPRIGEPDYFHRIVSTVGGSGFSSIVSGAVGGRALKTTGNSRLRYLCGDTTQPIANFSSFRKWTVFTGFLVAETASEDRTIFGKSANNGVAADRQIYARTNLEAAPSRIEVAAAESVPHITGAEGIELDTPYLCAITCDGTQSTSSMALYSAELFTGVIVDNGVTGQFNTTKNLATEVQFGAHFSDTNDDLDGQIFFFYYLPGIVCNREQVFQLARFPYGPITESIAPAIGLATAAAAATAALSGSVVPTVTEALIVSGV